MPTTLRILLFIGALFTLSFFLFQIRKKKLQIDYAVFWSLFSGALLAISVFPGVITWLAQIFGFMSPANLVFLIIIFILIVQMFSMTIKLSKLNQQIVKLVQELALRDKDGEYR